MIKLTELMTAEVRTCQEHDTLNSAAQMMWDNDCGAIPVVGHDGRVIGIVTDRDICMAAYTQGVPLTESRVDSAMARQVVTCPIDGGIAAAVKLMREHQVRRLPVVDEDCRPVGIISLSDLIRQAQSERASKSRKRQIKDGDIVETAGAICVPTPRRDSARAA